MCVRMEIAPMLNAERGGAAADPLGPTTTTGYRRIIEAVEPNSAFFTLQIATSKLQAPRIANLWLCE